MQEQQWQQSIRRVERLLESLDRKIHRLLHDVSIFNSSERILEAHCPFGQ